MDQNTFAEIFEQQAEWREGKAREYPDDTRNAFAAKHLRQLAVSAKSVPQSLITAAEELHEDAPDSEVWNEMLRQEGFHTEHENAEEFLKAFISNRSSGR